MSQTDEFLAAGAGDGRQEAGGLAVVALALVVLQQLEGLALRLPDALPVVKRKECEMVKWKVRDMMGLYNTEQ